MASSPSTPKRPTTRSEKIRHDLHEPYRTLLGHFRHEVGHYYWDRLVRDSGWLQPFRELFGDERADYAAALKLNYENGPPAVGEAAHQLLCVDPSLGGLGGDLGPLHARRRQPRHGPRLRKLRFVHLVVRLARVDAGR